MPSDNGAAWAPPAGTGERRLSNSSDGSAGSGYSKALPSDPSDYLQLRTKVVGGKPPANPLQFVKVGPCDLYRSAQDQLKRAQEVKKNKEVNKEELEDWQSNLDNWKSSRRKRVEHIIERCVEVKRMENEPVPGSRAKSKTFNEMLEERAGKRRRCPIALYPEEETTDLSDLGIGTSSTKSSLSEDCDTHSLASDGIDLEKNHSDVDNLSNCGSGNRKLCSSANEYDTCTTTTISSPEPEEYTYEGAIEGYKSRMSSEYKNYGFDKEKTQEKVANGDINRIRTTVGNKIEERVSSLTSKTSTEKNQKKDLPKVDILKRREHFEKESSPDTGIKPKLPEISNKKSIKERLSSLEKFTEEQNKSSNDISKKIPTEVVPLKERLSSLEKLKSVALDTDKTKIRLSNGDLDSSKSVKQRLSSLKSQTSEEDVKIVKSEVKDVSISLKERLSYLDAAKNKEVHRQIHVNDCTKDDDSKEHSLKTTLSGIESQMQNFCRSFDSLDINVPSSPNTFERVQSLEELESINESRNNTSPSDVETEDSGIQTGRGHECTNQDTYIEEHLVSDDYFEEPHVGVKDVIDPVAEMEDQDTSRADTDSTSNYLQAVSHPNDDLSVTDEITEIQLDKDDEDTLKSLDPQDTSVIDALELAFQEIDTDGKSETIKTTNEHEHHLDTEINKKLESNNKQDTNKAMNRQKNETKANDNAIKPNDDIKMKEVSVGAFSNASSDYENIEIFYENGGVLGTGVDAAAFPLDLPRNALEPPKEKPPPPPAEDCVVDDVTLENGNFKNRHQNSTRRIKKEIQNKRTSFLGIEGQVEDYLDVLLAPRPDITSFLQEETKIEKLLYKKTLNHDMDSKLRESRDSGVDLDKPSTECWGKSPDTSNPHSRQSSEPYTQVTVTSDEDDSGKKPRKNIFNDKLTTKLEHIQTTRQPNCISEQNKMESLDKQLQKQQDCVQTNVDQPDGLSDDAQNEEVLRFERELLQLEQEELRRQRDNLLQRESQTRRMQKSVQDVNAITNGIDDYRQYPDHRRSMPNLLSTRDVEFAPFNTQAQQTYIAGTGHQNSARHFDSRSDSSCQLDSSRRFDSRRQVDRCPQAVEGSPKREGTRELPNVRPAPLPPKQRSKESVERELTMRSSRVPSAVDYVNIEKSVQSRPKPIVNGQVPPTNGQYHPMSRHTLQALSAAPTPKLISGADWLQARSRKQIPPSYNYNQHWLIQEAEQRRIEEQRAKMRSQPSQNQRHSYHHDPTAHQPQPRVHNLSSSQKQQPQPQAADSPSGAAARDRDGETVLSVSGRRKCSHCGDELGRGAAMIIESLSLCYHVWCFSCVVCGTRLGDGRAGADVRVRARRLHCHQCYSSDDGSKFSCV